MERNRLREESKIVDLNKASTSVGVQLRKALHNVMCERANTTAIASRCLCVCVCVKARYKFERDPASCNRLAVEARTDVSQER